MARPTKQLSLEEYDQITKYLKQGWSWTEIGKEFRQIPKTCRRRYEYSLHLRGWDEDKRKNLARLYTQLKSELWSKVAQELEVSPEAAEEMHWVLGQQGISSRAGEDPSSQSSPTTDSSHAQQACRQYPFTGVTTADESSSVFLPPPPELCCSELPPTQSPIQRTAAVASSSAFLPPCPPELRCSEPPPKRSSIYDLLTAAPDESQSVSSPPPFVPPVLSVQADAPRFTFRFPFPPLASQQDDEIA
ncbi:hypothetical protein BDV06DRAFT_228309 [Aspergillus oleicola]